MWAKPPPLSYLVDAVNDPSKPIGMRMRAAYFLRQVYNENGKESNERDEEKDIHSEDEDMEDDIQLKVVRALTKGVTDERHGSLMRHEFAYVLGQLRDNRSCSTLESVLQENGDCIMVRHECAEALGAISDPRSKPVLEKVIEQNSNMPELTDTCRLALNVMEWREGGGDPSDMPAACACMLNPYSSVDPAPPNPRHDKLTSKELGDLLCDPEEPIFERYRAMFSLRNRGGEQAVLELCRALTKDQSSALLRHEVAYVLGQLQHPVSVEALEESLRRVNEHKMVRHESAEALGAIEGRWDYVERILRDYTEDDCDVVKESCIVALDAADYWGHNTNIEDQEDGEPSAESEKHSFAHQKAGQKVLVVNHFNVKE